MISWLYGLKVAILVTTGFEQSEMVGPKKALEKAGATVHIVSLTEGKVQGWDWMALEPRDYFHVDAVLKNVTSTGYDALVLPGGLNSPDDLRLDDNAVNFVRDFKNKPIAAICHGPWLLINADLVRDKMVTSWPSIKVDLINAGGKWIDAEVVQDGNLVTSRMPDDVPAFNKAMIELFAQSGPLAFHPEKVSKIAAIENCLKNCYQVENTAIAAIVLKLSSLIEKDEYWHFIEEFIEKSNALEIPFSNENMLSNLSPEDAVFQASKWHEVLFESSHVRILWGKSNPGDHEPFHTHQWRSIMVITQEGKYEIQNSEGSIEKDLWPIGVYELPAETFPSCYANIGDTEFESLRFEVKD